MRKIIVLLTLSLMLLTSCSSGADREGEDNADKAERIASEPEPGPKQELPQETEPAATPAKVLEPVPAKKFLLQNGIQIDPDTIAKETQEINLRIDCPKIKGLVDKKLQDKLNEELGEYSKDFHRKTMPVEIEIEKKPEGQGQKFEKWLSYSINSNYNNVLSLTFYYNEVFGPEFNESKTVPVSYELMSGKRLGINDLFAEGTDGIKLVNEKIVNHIIRENMEEWALCRPFQGIHPDQPFYLTENMLVVIFDSRSEEFVYPNYQIGIPFDEFDGTIAVYDKYFRPEDKLYEKGKLKKKMLPAPIKVKWDFKREDKPEYHIWVQIAKFENIENKELEKKLNSTVFDIDLEGFKKAALKAYESSKQQVTSSRVVNMAIHANMGDFLSMSIYDGTSIGGKEAASQRKFASYNMESGRELALKDLFNEGCDYKKNIRENIIRQLGDRKIPEADLARLDKAIDGAGFFFDEMAVHLNFKPGMLSKDIKEEIQIFNPFEEFGQENISIFN